MEHFAKGISVVIPTYNSKDILKKTLNSLSRQTLRKDRFEVIVIDDGSSDHSYELIEEFDSKMDLKYFRHQDKGFRVSLARNIGASLSQYEVLLFLDAGMIASKHLLQKHLSQHLHQNNLVVVGMSYGINEYSTENESLLKKLISEADIDKTFANIKKYPEVKDCRYKFLSTYNFDLSKISNPWIIFWTSQVSCRKTQFNAVGGFDEWFTSWGGEDVEFGLRLFKHGCPFDLLPSIESIHHPHFKDPDKRKQTSMENIEYIHEKHRLQVTQLLKTHSWEEIANVPPFGLIAS